MNEYCNIHVSFHLKSYKNVERANSMPIYSYNYLLFSTIKYIYNSLFTIFSYFDLILC